MMKKEVDNLFFKHPPLGKTPKNWEVVRLKDTIEEIKNGFASGKRDKDGIVQVRMNNVTTNGNLVFDSYLKVPVPEKLDEWLLKENDFLFNNTNSYDLVGKSTVFNEAPFPCTFSNHFTRIRFKRNIVLPEIILQHFIILWRRGYFKSVAIRHVGQSAVNKEYLLKLKLLLPPLPEQQKIVEILGTVDEAIEKVDKAIEKTQRLKKGLMQQLLTKGIGHKEFKDTKVGKIPKEWEVLKLGEVCNQRREIIHPTNKKNLRFVGLEHLVSGENSLRTYAPSTSIKSTKFRFFSNDILYGKLRPYLDKAVITDFDGICSTDLIVLVPEKNRVIGKLLTYIIHSKIFINIAISTTAGTNHPRTSWNAISKFKFALPSLLVQKKIAEILNTVDKRLELLRVRKEKFERIKKGLMNDLLTGEKRVRV